MPPSPRTCAGLIAALALLAPAAAGKEPRTRTGDGARDALRGEAIEEALRYLERTQKLDGSWGRPAEGGVGITALCLLAFFAQGHQEHRGPYGSLLHRGVKYLMAKSLPPSERDPALAGGGKPTGYIFDHNDRDSRMHGHGYATQVLVLAYGAGRAQDPHTHELKRKVQLAIRVIENSQTFTGGWGYEPSHSTFHEGSVTVTAVQALRLARDAGFIVDEAVQKQGLEYLKQSQKDDGSFKYSLGQDHTTSALTAAAITAMYGFGQYYGDSIRKGLSFLRSQYRHPDYVDWPHYGNYYAAQAFWRSGGPDWDLWSGTVIPHLLRTGIRDSERPGVLCWDDSDSSRAPRSHGRDYATALTVLALSVEDGYLPIFQK